MRIFAIIIALALVVAACTSPEKRLIADYVQRFDDNTVIDLKLKFQSITHKATITVADSLAMLTDSMQILIARKIPDYQEMQDYYAKRAEDDQRSAQISKFMADFYLESLESNNEQVEKYRVMIANLQNGITVGTPFEAMQQRIDQYSGEQSAPLAHIYTAVYSAFNPMLQTRQTITRDFYFSADKTAIIRQSD